jgi:hypothetical protein
MNAQYNNGHLPTSQYGTTKITTAWMLRDKQQAREEPKAPRTIRNPFARSH